jgi:hypothetical protein
MSATMTLWLFWATAGLAAVAVLAGLAARRLSPLEVLTAREWRAAAQVAAILLMVVVIVYFQNAHRYDAAGFIYGRF